MEGPPKIGQLSCLVITLTYIPFKLYSTFSMNFWTLDLPNSKVYI